MTDPAAFERAATLRNRTFVGLLIAQFLAAFNDQAIHASAMFFAINKKTLTEQTAISLMPILFFAPWAIFSTLAGYYADKYSKRFALILWKVAEVGITALALFGFVLGSELNMPNAGVWVVLSTVFLMGTHSTFFVPAKYGAMPEILQDHLLSRGNGLLESLSFLATILGTVCGGLLSMYFHDDEYWIGVILVVLALVGAGASLLIRRMPPANTARPFPEYVYAPLLKNLVMLWRSRPLRFVMVGIAFFTFMLAYMRAAVYMLGESQVPRWDELRTSLVVGATALGIGLGSPMAGWLSGKKVELGLVPIGGFGMVAVICVAALVLHQVALLIVCIVLIGFFTGFYLVPLFTQQQHRAPKKMKGDVIATCNFTNVVGAILASLLFYLLVLGAHAGGLAPAVAQEDVFESRVLTLVQEDTHHRPQLVQIVHKDDQGRVVSHRELGKRDPNRPVAAPADLLDDVLGRLGVPHVLPPEGERVDAGRAGRRFADETNQQVILSQKAQVAWNDREQRRRDGGQPPDVVVTVSRYVIDGVMVNGRRESVPHYYVRLERYGDQFTGPEPPPQLYDNRELPRYLFLGAGVMTLGVLLVLIRLLPDLLRRTAWVVRSLGKPRLVVHGVQGLPGHGAVILATNAATPEELGNLASASDRQVHFAGSDVAKLAGWLERGHVVGLTVGPQNGATLDKLRQQFRGELTILPAYCGPALVQFGEPLPGDAPLEQVLDGIRRAERADEH